MKKVFLGVICFITISVGSESYYEKGKLVEVEEVRNNKQMSIKSTGETTKFYKNKNSKKVGLTNKILLQCNDTEDCVVLLNDFNIREYAKLTKDIYIIKLDKGDDVFKLSRELFESGRVKFAHPNFKKERRMR